jgi:hypothetical protein
MKASTIRFRCWILPVFLTNLLLMVNSCELTNDIIGNVAVTKLEGEWNCDEDSEYFKKKSTSSAYSVYISPDPDNENGLLIDGFYNLGDIGVKAEVYGLSITIPEQIVEGGYKILSGNGIVSSNYREITWTYNINIGGDAVDHVTATYTKVN